MVCGNTVNICHPSRPPTTHPPTLGQVLGRQHRHKAGRRAAAGGRRSGCSNAGEEEGGTSGCCTGAWCLLAAAASGRCRRPAVPGAAAQPASLTALLLRHGPQLLALGALDGAAGAEGRSGAVGGAGSVYGLSRHGGGCAHDNGRHGCQICEVCRGNARGRSGSSLCIGLLRHFPALITAASPSLIVALPIGVWTTPGASGKRQCQRREPCLRHKVGGMGGGSNNRVRTLRRQQQAAQLRGPPLLIAPVRHASCPLPGVHSPFTTSLGVISTRFSSRERCMRRSWAAAHTNLSCPRPTLRRL